MTGFQVKEIRDQSLGELLRDRRTERGETPDDVERATHVAKKYLAALEENDFKKLPDPVYARHFVRTLARHYGFDPEIAAANLVREMSVTVGSQAVRHPVNFIAGRTLMVTPKVVKGALLGACFLAVVGYFAFSVHHILKAPRLMVYSPQDDQVFYGQEVALEGLTEPEVELTVNGEEVPIEPDGSFKDTLNLPPGVSSLRVAARKKHSRENEIFLKVVVEEPKSVAGGPGLRFEP